MSDIGNSLSKICVTGRGGCSPSITEAECVEELNNWQVNEVKKGLANFDCTTSGEVVDSIATRFETICDATTELSREVDLWHVCKTGGSWGKSVTESDCANRFNQWQLEYARKYLEEGFSCTTERKVIDNIVTRFATRCSGSLKNVLEEKKPPK